MRKFLTSTCLSTAALAALITCGSGGPAEAQSASPQSAAAAANPPASPVATVGEAPKWKLSANFDNHRQLGRSPFLGLLQGLYTYQRRVNYSLTPPEGGGDDCKE